MNDYADYVNYLESLVVDRGTFADPAANQQIAAALDGEPGAQLRKTVDLQLIRETGAYFTQAALSDDLVRSVRHRSGIPYYDPAFGVGDLLLACARRLPAAGEVLPTLSIWEKALAGIEINSYFVRAAKARLVLLAMARTRRPSNLSIRELRRAFPPLQNADALATNMRVDSPTTIVLNPPFSLIETPSDCSWSSGKVSAAAVFFSRSLRAAPEGSWVAAILPDVLRSGSRYTKWRESVRDACKSLECAPVGRFAPWADIDVFKILTRKGPRPRGSVFLSSPGRVPCVGDRYAVHVGPVVPHRHPIAGAIRPFAHARNLAALCEGPAPAETRRFRGTVFAPPFVAIRRTSRPGDRPRIRWTIVTGSEAVAVENHLLVCTPNDGTLASCRRLARVLSSEQTSQWLDNRIRCRHLTVSAVAAVPWESP